MTDNLGNEGLGNTSPGSGNAARRRQRLNRKRSQPPNQQKMETDGYVWERIQQEESDALSSATHLFPDSGKRLKDCILAVMLLGEKLSEDPSRENLEQFVTACEAVGNLSGRLSRFGMLN